jgi:hypothetical protein
VNKLKWIAVTVLAITVGLVIGALCVFFSLLVGSWIPLVVASGLAGGAIGFALTVDR